MRDMDIRLGLKKRLLAEHGDDPNTLILDELGLCQGASRVDIAVINGAITGYEIKSERDTLERLPFQVEIYSRTLDQVTIVGNGCHLEGIIRMVPGWWGIKEALEEENQVQFVTHRPPGDNPEVDATAVVQLLWRDEALETLTELGLERGLLSKPREVLWSALVANLELEGLKTIVRERLKARANWRSGR